MVRKNFILTPPYREITNADGTKRFTNELFDNNNPLTLQDLVQANHDDQYVIVYEQNGNVLAFLLFEEKNTYVYLNLVATNRLFDSGLQPGTKLVELLDVITKNFGHNRIELYSVQDKIEYYEELGYQNIGEIECDSVYGEVTKMVKLLSRD
jgi:hypothetical protein